MESDWSALRRIGSRPLAWPRMSSMRFWMRSRFMALGSARENDADSVTDYRRDGDAVGDSDISSAVRFVCF